MCTYNSGLPLHRLHVPELLHARVRRRYKILARKCLHRLLRNLTFNLGLLQDKVQKMGFLRLAVHHGLGLAWPFIFKLVGQLANWAHFQQPLVLVQCLRLIVPNGLFDCNLLPCLCVYDIHGHNQRDDETLLQLNLHANRKASRRVQPSRGWGRGTQP